MCKYKKDQKEKCACLEKQKLHIRNQPLLSFSYLLVFAGLIFFNNLTTLVFSLVFACKKTFTISSAFASKNKRKINESGCLR